jgi:hypothetical protein
MDVSNWMASLGRSFDEVAGRIQQHLPNALGAIGLVLLGWLMAWLLSTWVVKLVGVFERRFHDKLPAGSMPRVGAGRRASTVVGAFVFWSVFVIFLGAATEALGLPVLATWLSGLSEFLPRLLLATLIVMAGVLAGTLARDAIRATMSGFAFDRALGRLAQGAIIAAATITGVDQIGVDSTFLTGATMIVLAALFGGCALAFGFGARTAAANIIAIHYARQAYRTGQQIRLGSVDGTIREFTSTAVMVDTAEGRVLVPGKAFAERISTLVGAGD